MNEETVKTVLTRCSAEVEGGADLVIDKVELLNKEKDPRTKCWKVVVPYRFKTVMEKDEVYPTGWRHRTFFAGSRKSFDREKDQSSKVKKAIRNTAEKKILNDQ